MNVKHVLQEATWSMELILVNSQCSLVSITSQPIALVKIVSLRIHNACIQMASFQPMEQDWSQGLLKLWDHRS